MRIKSASGVDLPQIPKDAWCEISGISPEKMQKCPFRSFDDRGDYCVPELCEYYRVPDPKRKEQNNDEDS